MYRQVGLWRPETFRCNIGYDSKARVNRLGIDERKWECEICGGV